MAMAEEEVRARRISFRLDRREPPLLALRERSRPRLTRRPPYTCRPRPNRLTRGCRGLPVCLATGQLQGHGTAA